MSLISRPKPKLNRRVSFDNDDSHRHLDEVRDIGPGFNSSTYNSDVTGSDDDGWTSSDDSDTGFETKPSNSPVMVKKLSKHKFNPYEPTSKTRSSRLSPKNSYSQENDQNLVFGYTPAKATMILIFLFVAVAGITLGGIGITKMIEKTSSEKVKKSTTGDDGTPDFSQDVVNDGDTGESGDGDEESPEKLSNEPVGTGRNGASTRFIIEESRREESVEEPSVPTGSGETGIAGPLSGNIQNGLRSRGFNTFLSQRSGVPQQSVSSEESEVLPFFSPGYNGPLAGNVVSKTITAVPHETVNDLCKRLQSISFEKKLDEFKTEWRKLSQDSSVLEKKISSIITSVDQLPDSESFNEVLNKNMKRANEIPRDKKNEDVDAHKILKMKYFLVKSLLVNQEDKNEVKLYEDRLFSEKQSTTATEIADAILDKNSRLHEKLKFLAQKVTKVNQFENLHEKGEYRNHLKVLSGFFLVIANEIQETLSQTLPSHADSGKSIFDFVKDYMVPYLNDFALSPTRKEKEFWTNDSYKSERLATKWFRNPKMKEFVTEYLALQKSEGAVSVEKNPGLVFKMLLILQTYVISSLDLNYERIVGDITKGKFDGLFINKHVTVLKIMTDTLQKLVDEKLKEIVCADDELKQDFVTKSNQYSGKVKDLEKLKVDKKWLVAGTKQYRVSNAIKKIVNDEGMMEIIKSYDMYRKDNSMLIKLKESLKDNNSKDGREISRKAGKWLQFFKDRRENGPAWDKFKKNNSKASESPWSDFATLQTKVNSRQEILVKNLHEFGKEYMKDEAFAEVFFEGSGSPSGSDETPIESLKKLVSKKLCHRVKTNDERSKGFSKALNNEFYALDLMREDGNPVNGLILKLAADSMINPNLLSIQKQDVPELIANRIRDSSSTYRDGDLVTSDIDGAINLLDLKVIIEKAHDELAGEFKNFEISRESDTGIHSIMEKLLDAFTFDHEQDSFRKGKSSVTDGKTPSSHAYALLRVWGEYSKTFPKNRPIPKEAQKMKDILKDELAKIFMQLDGDLSAARTAARTAWFEDVSKVDMDRLGEYAELIDYSGKFTVKRMCGGIESSRTTEDSVEIKNFVRGQLFFQILDGYFDAIALSVKNKALSDDKLSDIKNSRMVLLEQYVKFINDNLNLKNKDDKEFVKKLKEKKVSVLAGKDALEMSKEIREKGKDLRESIINRA